MTLDVSQELVVTWVYRDRMELKEIKGSLEIEGHRESRERWVKRVTMGLRERREMWARKE